MCVEQIDSLYMSKACVCLTHVCRLGVHMGGSVCVWFGGIHCLISLAVVIGMYVCVGRWGMAQRGKYKDGLDNQILFS